MYMPTGSRGRFTGLRGSDVGVKASSVWTTGPVKTDVAWKEQELLSYNALRQCRNITHLYQINLFFRSPNFHIIWLEVITDLQNIMQAKQSPSSATCPSSLVTRIWGYMTSSRDHTHSLVLYGIRKNTVPGSFLVTVHEKSYNIPSYLLVHKNSSLWSWWYYREGHRVIFKFLKHSIFNIPNTTEHLLITEEVTDNFAPWYTFSQ